MMHQSSGTTKFPILSRLKSSKLILMPITVIEASENIDEPHIAGQEIAVRDIVVWHQRMGISEADIASEYGLTPAEIDAALTYYRDHRAMIDEAIQAEEESERRWDELFAKSADALAARAAKASADYRAGQTYPLDPDAL
jgi:uncharacterized protein (DUF433 family)